MRTVRTALLVQHGQVTYMRKLSTERKAKATTDPTEVSVSAARDGLPELINRAAYGSERFVIVRRGKHLAALVSAADLEHLKGVA